MTEWLAYTPIEGPWAFTRSDSPSEAIEKLIDALKMRHAMRVPVPGNEIRAVLGGEATGELDAPAGCTQGH